MPAKKPAARRTYAKKKPTTFRKTARPSLLANPRATVPRPVSTGVEVKYKDTAISITNAFNASSRIIEFDGPDQGDGITQREGRVIRQLGGEIRLRLEKGTTPNYANFRVILVQWKQAQAPPGVSDVLLTDSLTSSYNQNEAGNFRVLFDSQKHIENVPPYGGAATATPNVHIIRKKFKVDAKQTFISTGVGDAGDWSYQLILMSDVSTTAFSSFVGVARLYWTDV